MKKSRLIFYWAVLVVLMILYYGIGDSFFSTSQINLNGGALVGVQLIGLFMAPFTLVLGFIRLWILRPLNQRLRLFDITYFAIPVLMTVACFAVWLWVGIILSVIAGVLIGHEFIMSIIKMDSMLLRKNVV